MSPPQKMSMVSVSAPGVFSGLLPSTGRPVDPGFHPQPGPLLTGAALAANPGKCSFSESGGTEVAQLVRGLSRLTDARPPRIPCRRWLSRDSTSALHILVTTDTLRLWCSGRTTRWSSSHIVRPLSALQSILPNRCSSSCCCRHRPSDPCVCAHIRHGCAGYQSLPRVYPTLWP